MKAKGHDWRYAILLDGRQVDIVTYPNSLEVDFGLEVEVTNHVGQKKPFVRGNNKECTFGCPFDVDSIEYLKLVKAQREKNLPNAERKNIRIDVSCSVDFGPEGRGRYGFSDCTLSGAGLSVTGRTEGNTTGSPVFTAPEVQFYGL